MATKFDYFDQFVAQAEVCLQEAELLVEAVNNFSDAESLREITERAHAVEHQGDEINHAIYNNVASDFITPIERDDLISIAQCLDTVIDNIEEVMISFYMYDVHDMLPAAKEFATIIERSATALAEAMKEFRNFKKSTTLRDLFIKVNDCEEEGDRLFFSSMRELYTKDADQPMKVLVWSRLLNRMETCCDACEHVADVVNAAVLKNS